MAGSNEFSSTDSGPLAAHPQPSKRHKFFKKLIEADADPISNLA
jgi:hypothetical protein